MTRPARRRRALVAAWPLLLAASAPIPPTGFASGVNGLPRALDTTLPEARAAGFDTVRIFLRWDKIETTEGAPDWTCRYVTEVDLGPDAERDGTADPWPGIPCDGTPCGCGSSPRRSGPCSAGTISALECHIGYLLPRPHVCLAS